MPLYVALAQRKEDRKAHLASQYIQRMAGMRMQGMAGMQQMGMGGYFMPTMPQPQRFFTPAQIRAQPRWPAQPGGMGAPRPQPMPGMTPMARPGGPGVRPGSAPRMSAPPAGAGRPQMVPAGGQPMMMARPGMAPVPGMNQQVRGPPAQLHLHQDGQEPAWAGDGPGGPGRGCRRHAPGRRPDPRPGAADCDHVGRRPAAGAEADVG